MWLKISTFADAMDFRTVVQLPQASFRLTPSSHIVMLGSCFAEYIGEKLEAALPDGTASVNPYGVLYNPESIRRVLCELFFEQTPNDEQLCFKGNNGLWHHWLFSSVASADSQAACLALVEERRKVAKVVCAQADVLMVTFSSDHVYRLRSEELAGLTVANCHKEPAVLFEEKVLDVEQEFGEWDMLLKRLAHLRPGLKVVFTLSPYRYLKYGLMESQMGKARLLYLIGKLQVHNPNVQYFPAYEIVVDELRDYRFYDRDMLHPSAQAVDYIWERFQAWCFSSELVAYSKEKQALHRFLSHRPHCPNSEVAQQHFAECEQRKKDFATKWEPYITR
ncbi:MAG: GSCFA domain-containing protein [Bacteroidaceae bacterium]|nr:GSCFA domain-containing protein [Bacteroidaceae bacterium]